VTGEDVITTDIRDLHRRATEGFDHHVTTVRPEQWGLPTPCTGWDVRALVNHVVSGNRWTPELLAGHTISDVGDRFEGDVLGDDAIGAWTDSAAVAAARNSDMTEPVHLSSGPGPAAEYLTQVFADLVIHTWDLARALGANESPSPSSSRPAPAARSRPPRRAPLTRRASPPSNPRSAPRRHGVPRRRRGSGAATPPRGSRAPS
jgi:uncharacterized protein (TIGR03086 family)